MASLLGQVGEMTGIGQGGGNAIKSGMGVGDFFTVLLVILIFGIIAAVVTVMIVLRRQYKYKIVIFERVDGRFKVTRRDGAKSIKIGNQGDEVFFLRKHKKILSTPQIQTGDNTFWFYVSDDGEWINFGPGDFDENRREMGAFMLDKEMRAFRMALHHLADQRMGVGNFWEKYGGVIAFGVLILMLSIGFWLVTREMAKIVGSMGGLIEAAKSVVEATNNLLGGLSNVQGGGTGYIPA